MAAGDAAAEVQNAAAENIDIAVGVRTHIDQKAILDRCGKIQMSNHTAAYGWIQCRVQCWRTVLGAMLDTV